MYTIDCEDPNCAKCRQAAEGQCSKEEKRNETVRTVESLMSKDLISALEKKKFWLNSSKQIKSEIHRQISSLIDVLKERERDLCHQVERECQFRMSIIDQLATTQCFDRLLKRDPSLKDPFRNKLVYYSKFDSVFSELVNFGQLNSEDSIRLQLKKMQEGGLLSQLRREDYPSESVYKNEYQKHILKLEEELYCMENPEPKGNDDRLKKCDYLEVLADLQKCARNVQISERLENLCKSSKEAEQHFEATPDSVSFKKVGKDNSTTKCQNFLNALIELAEDETTKSASNVKRLIQNLIDGAIKPEEFSTQLEKELNYNHQPYLVAFLKKNLPDICQALISGEMSIEGIHPPPVTASLQNEGICPPPVTASLQNEAICPPPVTASLENVVPSTRIEKSRASFRELMKSLEQLQLNCREGLHNNSEQLMNEKLKILSKDIENRRRHLRGADSSSSKKVEKDDSSDEDDMEIISQSEASTIPFELPAWPRKSRFRLGRKRFWCPPLKKSLIPQENNSASELPIQENKSQEFLQFQHDMSERAGGQANQGSSGKIFAKSKSSDSSDSEDIKKRNLTPLVSTAEREQTSQEFLRECFGNSDAEAKVQDPSGALLSSFKKYLEKTSEDEWLVSEQSLSAGNSCISNRDAPFLAENLDQWVSAKNKQKVLSDWLYNAEI